jgi:N-acetylglucosaminyldiphosphoundecaprenol N-acetyl-beta-D-mannosaminyltransferase
LALPDGVGLIWGSRILRRALRGRATGVGTVVALAEASAAPAGPSIFLLGAAPGVAASAAARLQERFPGARIAGTWSGSPAESDWPEIGHLIDTASPDILLVAFGAPAQDLWIAAHRGELTCRVAMGIGGSLDYIAGVVPYAPAWVRRLGLEWLYRLIRQPWRWRRMLRLPRFVWLMLLQRPRR